jgi:hypothetical protein
MPDYIIDTDSEISFTVKYQNKTILEEKYIPDTNYKVRTHKLGKFCALALWGEWNTGRQEHVAGTFDFLINGAVNRQTLALFSRMQTTKQAATAVWLSEVNRRTARSGTQLYVSALMAAGQVVQLKVYKTNNTTVTKTLSTNSGTLGVVTLPADANYIAGQVSLPIADIRSYELTSGGETQTFLIDQTRYTEVWQFEYKNVYDVPEVLTAVGGLSVKGNNESETAAMNEVERKFGIKVTDEYTVNSGVIFLQSDYKLWHNLVNAQEARILINGIWYSIVITKHTYEREFRKSLLKAVEFSFRMADAEQNNLIDI